MLAAAVAVCALVCGQARAQRYSFRSYAQGLRNLNIVCVVQDRTGYLWVGTQNGLYRYDGTQFQEFGPAQGVPERMVQALYVDVGGTLWVATTTGIYFELPSGQFAEVQPPAGDRAFQVSAGTPFTAVRRGEVVVASVGGGYRLRQISRNDWKAEPLSLGTDRLRGVAYTPDGTLWYGCDRDLCRLSNGEAEPVGAALGMPQDKWTSLLVAHDGHLWLRGPEHIVELDLHRGRFSSRDVAGSGPPEAYPLLAEDAQRRILTTRGASLGIWEKGAWRWVTERNGLGTYVIQCLYEDREGSLWLGEVGHGLKRWVGQDHWEGYTRADGLSSDLVWATERDGKGRLWVGTQEGLDWTAAGAHTPHAWRLPDGRAMSSTTLAVGSDGSVWAANVAGELVRIDPVTLKGRVWKLAPIGDLATDGHGTMLIASVGGLYRIDERNGKTPELVRSPVFTNPQGRFTSLCLDGRGRMWATADQGLVVEDESGWHAIDMGRQRTAPDVIAVDGTGAVWVSGPAQDLTRLRVENYRVVDARHVGRPPLLSQQVVALMVDHRGWLWVGQDQGLSVFDGYAWRSYTQDDGLIWNDTDSFALYEDKDGSLWVGTSGGLAHLLTPGEQQHLSPQAPTFTKVLYGGEQLENGSSVRWASNAVEISLALLSFKSTQDTRLRFRLLGPGQPGDWEESHEMLLHYRHLAPGAYRFEVTEIDQAGRVVSPEATFAFRITPRWWQLRWLRIGLGVLMVFALIFIWRQRIGQLLRQKKQLEEAVQMRTVALEREKGELLRTKEQMRHYAEHDDLTGLWNHRIIVERLQIEVTRSRREGLPLSVILVDLDFFKNINDTFGHPAGDSVLRGASAIFQRMVRTYDWVGRYGGEEFLLILPGSGFTHARERAEELRKALEAARVHDGDSLIPVTASFGVASGFPPGHEEMIRQADAALYRAKNQGRNCVVAVEVDARKMPRRA